jgi:hypothetical protein
MTPDTTSPRQHYYVILAICGHKPQLPTWFKSLNQAAPDQESSTTRLVVVARGLGSTVEAGGPL